VQSDSINNELLIHFILWLSIIGVGSLVNTNYLLIELRVPPEELGSSLTIIFTICIFGCSISPNLAYLS